MTSAPQVSSMVSKRYAGALIDLAVQNRALEAVEKDVKALESMVADSDDLKSLIRSPLFSADQQRKAIGAIAAKAKFHKLTTNFLNVLAENRRLNALEGLLKAIKQGLSEHRGEVKATVKTASALTAAQTKALQSAISKAVGSDVSLEAKTDPDILGGMIVTVGSHMIDDSVRRKLERLKNAMHGGANQNTETQQTSTAIEEVG